MAIQMAFSLVFVLLLIHAGNIENDPNYKAVTIIDAFVVFFLNYKFYKKYAK